MFSLEQATLTIGSLWGYSDQRAAIARPNVDGGVGVGGGSQQIKGGQGDREWVRILWLGPIRGQTKSHVPSMKAFDSFCVGAHRVAFAPKYAVQSRGRLYILGKRYNLGDQRIPSITDGFCKRATWADWILKDSTGRLAQIVPGWVSKSQCCRCLSNTKRTSTKTFGQKDGVFVFARYIYGALTMTICCCCFFGGGQVI